MRASFLLKRVMPHTAGGRIEEALDIISGNRDALQAWELFPLFPEVTRPWMHQQPQRQANVIHAYFGDTDIVT